MEIQIDKVLDYIQSNAPVYAKAKAERIYIEQYLKSKKAMLMIEAEKQGVKTVSAQENYALSHIDYMEVLNGLQAAVIEEEKLRWMLTAAQAKLEVWRSRESTRRIEAKL